MDREKIEFYTLQRYEGGEVGVIKEVGYEVEVRLLKFYIYKGKDCIHVIDVRSGVKVKTITYYEESKEGMPEDSWVDEAEDYLHSWLRKPDVYGSLRNWLSSEKYKRLVEVFYLLTKANDIYIKAEEKLGELGRYDEPKPRKEFKW